MWESSYSAKAQTTPEIVWQIWTDVENWNQWDSGVQWCKMEGAFEEGVKGKLKPKGGPVSSLKLVEVIRLKKFVDQAALPLAKLLFIHELDLEGQQVKITHTIRIAGPLSFLFARLLGAKLAKDLPSSVKNLARLAQEKFKATA